MNLFAETGQALVTLPDMGTIKTITFLSPAPKDMPCLKTVVIHQDRTWEVLPGKEALIQQRIEEATANLSEENNTSVDKKRYYIFFDHPHPHGEWLGELRDQKTSEIVQTIVQSSIGSYQDTLQLGREYLAGTKLSSSTAAAFNLFTQAANTLTPDEANSSANHFNQHHDDFIAMAFSLSAARRGCEEAEAALRERFRKTFEVDASSQTIFQYFKDELTLDVPVAKRLFIQTLLDENPEAGIDFFISLELKDYPQNLLPAIFSVLESNPAKGESYLRWAAEHHIPEAQYELGMRLIESNQTEEGLSWLQRAEKKGHTKALNNREAHDFFISACAFWEGKKTTITTEGHALNVTLFALASRYGQHKIKPYLKQKFCDQFGFIPSWAHILAFFQNTQWKGELNAIWVLSKDLFKKDPLHAFDLLKLAADKGDAQSQYQYGMGLLEGVELFLRKDRDLGIAYLKSAADSGHVEAQYEYGMLFNNYDYLKKAAKQGHSLASEECRFHETGKTLRFQMR